MTTNTNQQVAQSETLEEIASKITRRWGSQYRTQLQAAIVAALRNERERCAKVADDKADKWGALADSYYREGDRSNALIRQGWASGAQAIATAIRDGR